ncbi:hypothetical protein OJF2_50400 [Aquisphaera giovannonii]|uniref:Uncharacterized protein n=1 Tax=Aquisphaera giovannonii TaxID=406548 RepID=A0A5B9W732_9BACT|nr:hypothetical protein [Aquisphaera giovannonii]QEH36476.1 hypothetical protein OJF2_50400 [Aquisphaera giovannonii]
MARKKTAAPKHVEPEDESQDVEEPDTEDQDDEPEASGGKGMSKAEAIRRVMADGIDNPSVGSQEIRKRFGIDVTPQHFSAARSQMKSRDAKKSGAPKGKPGRKPKAASQGVEGYLAPPPKQQGTGGEPDLLEAMEAMKPLVNSLGADKVKRIVDLLG